MADKVKVFKNLADSTATAGLGVVSLNVLTNNSTTQAVVKDLSFTIRHPTADYAAAYKYPFKLKLDNYTITSGNAIGTYSGSQIVDANQTLSVEIQAETQAVDYGVLELAGYLNNNFYYTKLSLNTIGTVPSVNNLLGAIDPRNANIYRTQTQWIPAPTGSYYNAVIVNRSGQTQIIASKGSNFDVINTNGVIQNTVGLPEACYGMAADSTYLYFKSTGNDSIIYRFAISTLANAGNLNLTANVPGMPATNSGSIDHYNGKLYIQSTGGTQTTYIINTANGATTSITIPSDGSSECIGAKITVNTSGVPFFVRQDDTRIVVYNLNTSETTLLTNPWATDPTTTQGKNIFVLANGFVMFNNASYGTSSVVNVNPSTPIVTLTTNILPLGGSTTSLMASSNFQTTPVNITRNITYDMHASGIEIT